LSRTGSAGASPSLQGAAIDFPRTGLPDWLTDDYLTMESSLGFFGSSHSLVMISCVFSIKHGAVQLNLESDLPDSFVHHRIDGAREIQAANLFSHRKFQFGTRIQIQQ
jgi:hypothetical protein